MDIAAGGPFSVILTRDGNVYTCGYGALGLGKETIQTLELSLVKELENKQIVKVFATTDYAAAITSKDPIYFFLKTMCKNIHYSFFNRIWTTLYLGVKWSQLQIRFRK